MRTSPQTPETTSETPNTPNDSPTSKLPSTLTPIIKRGSSILKFFGLVFHSKSRLDDTEVDFVDCSEERSPDVKFKTIPSVLERKAVSGPTTIGSTTETKNPIPRKDSQMNKDKIDLSKELPSIIDADETNYTWTLETDDLATEWDEGTEEHHDDDIIPTKRSSFDHPIILEYMTKKKLDDGIKKKLHDGIKK